MGLIPSILPCMRDLVRCRPRLVYIPLVCTVFCAGLATHVVRAHLPHFLAEYVPDTLWALWVFLVVVCIARCLSTERAAAYALAFAYLTELGQLYHTPWIDHIRSTTLGHLVLGDTFQWSDLLCYTAGIAIGTAVDLTLQQRQPRTEHRR